MYSEIKTPSARRRFSAISVAIFLVSVAGMGILRFQTAGSWHLSLTYGLPLLFCLRHPDRRLLWSMVLAFAAMAVCKDFVFTPADKWDVWLWISQMANTLVIAVVVHTVLNLSVKLRRRNSELEAANGELTAREEEISRQNEELQSQGEELAQQNEELQAQGEELAQQNEELQARTEETHAANQELEQREGMLRMLLESLRAGGDQEVLDQICLSALRLLEGGAAVGVVERVGEELVLRAQAGERLKETPFAFTRSFASIVMETGRTAYVDDLANRPDLIVPGREGPAFRSLLSAPLRIHARTIGAIEIYSERPRGWTAEQFRILEWVAAQCSLTLEVRRLHEELSHSNNRLEGLVRIRTAKLHELVNELEHFSYTITHDMRAPLRAMQGFAEILSEDEGTPEERRRYLGRIVTAAGRMDRLITDALSYSQAVQQELELVEVDPLPLLQGMLDSYPEFQSARAQIEIEPSLPRVKANQAGLTQCFSNLLTNAVKFVGEGRKPKVRVRGERREGMARIWIEDNGIGIEPEILPKIFGMFQRATRDYEGTGIGLALVRKVAERMGGRVGVESEPGKGSRFWLEFRAAE